MRILYLLCLLLISTSLVQAQCPDLKNAMINSCGTSEGDNEFVLFTTSVTANASTYTLRYGTTNPPSASTMSGADANVKTGPAVFTSGGGCTLVYVTNPATSIPSGSKVIFISTNADMNYDFTSLCGGGTIYVVFIKFNGTTSNWNPVGTFANSLGAGVSRYLQVTYSGSASCNNANAPVKSYQNGWSPNQDGDFVSWSGTTPTYSNDAAAINTPPADAAVCSPAASSFTVAGSGYQVTYQWQVSTDGGTTWTNVPNSGVYTGATSTTLNISNTSGLNNYKYRAIATALAPCSPTATSASATLTVTAAPVAVPVITQQPDCNTTTGTVTVSPVGANYNYNINGGAYQASNVFTGLTAGATYSFTVKDITGGCTSAPVSVTIGNIPSAPAAPTGSVTQQPTCTTPTGTIVISSPTGANYQYNINGGTYQSSPTFNSLSPNTYSVTVKDISTGCISSATTFTVNAIPGAPAAPSGSVTQQPTCTTPTGTIVITSPTGANYQYNINGGVYQSSTTFSSLSQNTYSVTVKDISTGCISSATSFTVNAIAGAPTAPTGSVTQQPTCTTPTGTIVITSPTGANYQYNINGGVYQSSTTFSSLSPNTYSITVKDISTGCISSATTFTVNAIPGAPSAPTGSVTQQPTCTTPTGTIVITSPTGANYQYNINGGVYQSSTTFSSLSPNTYSITVKDISTGCISSATTFTVNAIPGAPSAPTGSVTQQPTCTTPTGTIVISSPTGANYQYNINGGVYQSSTTFSSLSPNTYSVTVKDISTGCISSATTFVVNAIPGAPAAPTGSVTQQPTCTTPTGTIVISSPAGANYQYNINGGTYQASPTFNSLSPNTYSVTVKDISTGCISSATIFTVNAIPVAPAAPSGSVTQQPTCTTPTGTIVISSPTGANYQYNINGGVYQSSTTFSSLSPNTYSITVKDISTGCISSATTFTVNAIPGAPTAPTGTVTQQPTCTNPTGTIVISSPTGANFQYNFNGGAYQASPTFNSLSPNTYSITVKDISTGCISSATTFVVNAIPGAPTAPTGSVTQQPTCTTPTGTIVISSPTGANYQYNINGGIYQSSTTFSSLSPNTYSVTVKDISTGCISSATTFTVNAIPSAPTVPTGTVMQQPTCTTPTGTIVISSPIGANYQYNINGGAYQTSPTFNSLLPNTYSITVKDISTGCISSATSFTVNAIPGAPTAPTGTVTQQPTCTTPTGTIVISSPTGANYQYNINGGAYQASPSFNSLSPNTYSVTVKDISTGCISSAASFTVNASSPVAVSPITGKTVICINQNNSTQLSNNTSAGTWSSSNPNVASVDANGLVTAKAVGSTIISYTVTNGNCQNAATITVTVHDLQLSLSSSKNNIHAGESITLSTSANTTFNVTQWTPSQSFPNQTALIQNINPVSTQTYKVLATSVDGCTGSASILIIVKQAADDVFVPNAFTPNADGKNDQLLVFGNSITQLEMHIFNQWGQEIFITTDKSIGWDGTIKGKPQPVGVYVYALQATLSNGEFMTKKGTITLIR